VTGPAWIERPPPSAPRFWSAPEIAALPWPTAVAALEQVLRAGLDVESEPDRFQIAADAGDLLIMQSSNGRRAGAKLITIHTSPEPGEPSIQGLYVLFDGETLGPVAVLDGAALTGLRTPAVSALAARHLATRPVRRVVVLGSGVQARGHALALASIAGPDLDRLEIVARNAEQRERLVTELRERGLPAGAGAPDSIDGADVIACTTSAGVPLFEGRRVPDGTVVLAIGSHTLSTRDVDTDLVARSHVVVESRRSAGREAGAVMIPVAEGRSSPDHASTLTDLVLGRVHPQPDRPQVFVGTGMAWQDLAVADAVVTSG
jgi:ornithine cyclodeaminase